MKVIFYVDNPIYRIYHQNILRYTDTQIVLYADKDMPFYYIDANVLLENITSGVFSIS